MISVVFSTRMGSAGGKYNIKNGNFSQNENTTLRSISSKKIKSKKEKEFLPKCIHQDFLADSNNDNLTIVWLDTEIHQQSLNIDIQIKLRNLINSLRIFDEINAFEYYIQQINRINNQEKLFLIISTKLALTIIPIVYHRCLIKYIYIYGNGKIDKKTKEELLKKYSKVVFVFLYFFADLIYIF